MTTSTHKELKDVVLSWLKEHPEAATINFTQLHEEIGKEHPCSRAELAITVTFLNLMDEVLVEKDELGRGIGFALPETTPPAQ